MSTTSFPSLHSSPAPKSTVINKGSLENGFPFSPALTLNSLAVDKKNDDEYYRQINDEINQTNIRSDLQSIMTKSTSKSRLTNNSIRRDNPLSTDSRSQVLQSAMKKKQSQSSRSYTTPKNRNITSPKTSDYQSARSSPRASIDHTSEKSADNLSKKFFKSFEQLDKSDRGYRKFPESLEIPVNDHLENGAERYFTHLSKKYNVSKEDLLSLVTNELIDDAVNLKTGKVSEKYSPYQEFVKSPTYYNEQQKAYPEVNYSRNTLPAEPEVAYRSNTPKNYSLSNKSSRKSTPSRQYSNLPSESSTIDLESIIQKVRLETLEDARKEFHRELESYQKTKEVEDSALSQAMITAKIQARLQSKLEKEVSMLAELRKEVEDEILKKYDKSYWGWQYQEPLKPDKKAAPKAEPKAESKPKAPIKVYEFESTNTIPFVFPFTTVKTWPLFLANLKEAFPEHKKKISENNLKLYSKSSNVRILPSHWEYTLEPGMEIEVEFPKEKKKAQPSKLINPDMLMPPNMKKRMSFNPIGLTSQRPQLLPPTTAPDDSSDVSSNASSRQMKQSMPYQGVPYPTGQNNNGLLSKTLRWFTETERNPQYRMPMQPYGQQHHQEFMNNNADHDSIAPFEEAAALKDPEL